MFGGLALLYDNGWVFLFSFFLPSLVSFFFFLIRSLCFYFTLQSLEAFHVTATLATSGV